MTSSEETGVARPEDESATPQTEPRVDAGRYRYLDVLRGFALLGILLVNVAIFAEPLGTLENPQSFEWRPLREVVAAHAVLFFAQYKFITLFSFLFGVGMALLRERAEATGRSYARWMLRRLSVLLAIGIAHAWLVWYGDILVYYALLGFVLCWASVWSARTLTWVGATCIGLPLLILGGLALLAFAFPELGELGELDTPLSEEDSLAAAQVAVSGSWSEFFETLTTLPPAFEVAVYREASFLRATVLRMFSWFVALIVFGGYFVPRIAGLFLLGMAATRARWFLSPREHPRAFRRLTFLGLAAGLPLQGLALILFGAFPEDPRAGVLGETCVYLGSLGLAAGYAGLVGLVCARGPERSGPPAWTRPVEAVGRTALTNYLFQSALCTFFFYGQGPGLGFFGRVDRASQLVVVGVVWGLGLTLSPLWLATFRTGPIEWLWRSLTYDRRTGRAREAAATR